MLRLRVRPLPSKQRSNQNRERVRASVRETARSLASPCSPAPWTKRRRRTSAREGAASWASTPASCARRPAREGLATTSLWAWASRRRARRSKARLAAVSGPGWPGQAGVEAREGAGASVEGWSGGAEACLLLPPPASALCCSCARLCARRCAAAAAPARSGRPAAAAALGFLTISPRSHLRGQEVPVHQRRDHPRPYSDRCAPVAETKPDTGGPCAHRTPLTRSPLSLQARSAPRR